MSRTRKIVASVAVGTAILAAGTGVVLAKAGGDRDQPITGEELDKASVAALAHTGGGRVTGSELGDEEGYYEIEVTRADGRQVDVHLDRDFRVLNDVDDTDAGPDDADTGQDD